MVKEIISKEENVKQLIAGLDALADAVGSTLGPKGQNVIIQNPLGAAHITKDGVTVANSIELEGLQGVGARLLRTVASKSDTLAGDGTTTSTILARAIAKEGFKLSRAGIPSIEIKRGMDKAVKDIVEQLEKRATKVVSLDDIYHVAYVSSNGDVEIATLLKDAFDKAKDDGIIVVEDSETSETYIANVEGTSFDQGMLSPYFVNKIETGIVEYEDANILILEDTFDSLLDMQKMAAVLGTEVAKPLIVVAPDFSSEVLAMFIANRVRSQLPICCVKAKGFGDKRLEFIMDFAVSVGATTISKNAHRTMEDFELSWLGKCKKVIIDNNETIVMGGQYKEDQLKEHRKMLCGLIETAKTRIDEDDIKKRLANFDQGVVVIKVGGFTEVDVKERKDRIADALGSTRAAKSEGVIPGGGVALIRAAQSLEMSTTLTSGELAGYKMLLDCIEVPLHTLAENAGEKADFIVGKVMDAGKDTDFGWDARTGNYVNMNEVGIIDPLKVVRCALQNASAVAGLIFTSSCSIIEKQTKDSCSCKQQTPFNPNIMH